MTPFVLGIIAVLQAIFLVLLIGVLLAERTVLNRRHEQLARDRRRFVSAMHRHVRYGRSEEAEEVLRECPLAVISSVLQSLAVQLGGDEWERIVEIVHESPRMEEIRSRGSSRRWWRRLESARLLALLATEEDTELVHQLVNDRHAAVEIAAAGALDRIPSEQLVGAVLDRAVEAGGVVASYLIDLLCTNKSSLLSVLMHRLSEPRSDEELAMVMNLASELGIPSLIGYVAVHAEHENIEVRIATVRALGAFPHPVSSRALRLRLRDARWQVRAQAAAALGSICAIEAADELAAALTDTSWWVRLRSGLSLRRLGPTGSARLGAISPDADPFAYDMAQYVMGLSDSAMAEYSGAGLVNHADITMTLRVA